MYVHTQALTRVTLRQVMSRCMPAAVTRPGNGSYSRELVRVRRKAVQIGRAGAERLEVVHTGSEWDTTV